MNERMKSCHTKASVLMFTRRNTRSSLMKGVVDLHGLHVQEAVDCVDELLSALANGPPYIFNIASYFSCLKGSAALPQQITLITGSGLHSQGSSNYKPRLLPAIQTYLQSHQNVRFALLKDRNGFIGALRLDLL